MTEELKIKITAELKNLKENVKEGSKSIKDFVEKNKEKAKVRFWDMFIVDAFNGNLVSIEEHLNNPHIGNAHLINIE